jgi:hypothetical protein
MQHVCNIETLREQERADADSVSCNADNVDDRKGKDKGE